MHTTRQFVLVASLAFGLTSAAQATITYSPPVRSDEGDNLGCFVQNLSDAELEVHTEISNGLGVTIDPRTFTIPAGQVLQFSRTSSQVFGAYCLFDFEGSADQLRGFISLQDAGGSNTRLLFPAEPIVPSRPALITTTYSPPIRSDEGDNLGCFVQNLSEVGVEVQTEIENGLGTVIDPRTFVIPPGQVLQFSRTSSQVFGAYCRFTFEGNPSAVRGYISLQDAGGSNTRLLHPASTALGEPVASPTPTSGNPTPTATPGEPAGGCCGDCNGSGTVAINELITAVNYALDGCPAP